MVRSDNSLGMVSQSAQAIHSQSCCSRVDIIKFVHVGLLFDTYISLVEIKFIMAYDIWHILVVNLVNALLHSV